LRISRHNAKAAKVSLDGLCRCVAFAKGLLRRALLERSPSLLSHRTHSLHCEAVDASQAKARLDQAKAETDAKVKALQDQAKTASSMAKARIDGRIAAAKADFEVRSKKLSQAWTLTKEALAA